MGAQRLGRRRVADSDDVAMYAHTVGEHPASCVDPERCELAYVDHLRGFAVAAAATPTRRPDVVRIDAKDAAFERDAPAYRALRRQGFQPRDIDGCHELQATAKDRHDIEGTPRLSPQLQELTA